MARSELMIDSLKDHVSTIRDHLVTLDGRLSGPQASRVPATRPARLAVELDRVSNRLGQHAERLAVQAQAAKGK
jgi:hypothetical protein